jgi:hypothetical protein
MPSRRISEIGSQLSKTERRLLKGLYTSGSAAYGSVKALVNSSGLSHHKVLQFLHSNNAYTQYHIAFKKFPRLYVVAKSINEIWCMDLAQMDKLASHNNGVNFLLVSVDILSRFIRVQPMKNKTAVTTKSAFMKMMSTGEQPKKIWVDEGKEFEGSFKSLCIDMGVILYHTQSKKKAAYAERAIRSLKNIIYRHMEESHTYKYITRLPSFVKTMNSRVNRSIEMAPKNVTNRDALRIINARTPNHYKPSFKVGDYVRAVLPDQVFRKGYKPQFSREIYKISKISTTNPITYKIQNKEKKSLPGRFYEKQLIHYTV